MMRKISHFENLLIEGVAKRLPPNSSSKLRGDLRSALADDSFSDSGRIYFVIEGYCRPDYSGQHQYPVEIRFKDMDGADMTAILYADANDRLLELELIRWDGGRFTSPDIGSVSFY